MQCPHCFREVNTSGACPYCGYDGSDAAKRFPQALRPGSILNGRYIVGHALGQGGFGITYIAWDDSMKERVAIKEYFPAEFAGRTGISVRVHSENQAENFAYGKAKFLEEAKTLAAFIGCPGIVRIYSYFEENGTAYMTMEYVDGPPLDRYMAMRGGKLSPDEANRLLLPLMESLEAVHAKGIVHRDIAPDNILITRDGTAKLIDFGAARYSTGEKSKSLDVILKHGFAPYEQYMRRGRQGPWTDVYALAATYYYAITGKVPPESVERVQEDTLVPPSALGVKLGDTEDVLLHAMEVFSNDRIQSMGEFRRDMLEASGGQPVPKPKQTPKPTPKPTPKTQPKPVPEAPAAHTPAAETRPEKKRSLLPLILGAAAVLAVLLFFVFGGKRSTASPAVTEAPPATAAPTVKTSTPKPASAPTPKPGLLKSGVTENGLQYLIFSDHAEIYKYSGSSDTVMIPSEIEGIAVTEICGNVFSNYATVTSVTIPDGVAVIDDYAFLRCTALKSVTIPNTVVSLGKSVFSECSALTDITIPDGVAVIDDYAFMRCTALKSVTIPNTVVSLGRGAFMNCSALTDITIPGGIADIQDSAFMGCSALKSATILDGVTSIRQHAFSGCSALTSVTIPRSVTSIGIFAFSGSPVEQVSYGGTEDEWKAIKTDTVTNGLAKASIRYLG